MEQDLPHNTKIEEYLLGKLTAADQAQLDQQMLHDSHLAEEFELQQDIMRGLKETRRLELKARLDGIPVSTGLVYSPLAKIAAGTALVLAGAASTYLLINSPIAESSKLVSGLTLGDYTNTPSVTPAIPSPTGSTLEIIDFSTNTLESAAPTEAVSEIYTSAIQDLPNKNGDVPAKNAEVNKPNLITDFSDQETTLTGLLKKPENNVFSSQDRFKREPLEVSTLSDDDYDFHYQFEDDKLYIFGDFSSQPYEVLEINKQGKPQYFLFYQNSFYTLKNTQNKIKPLKKLTNKALIKELDITRSSK